MDPSKIIINGYFGYGNLGDEAILRAEIENLKNLSPNLKITVLVGDKKRYKAEKNICFIGRYNIIQITHRMKNSSAYITGGGGIFQDKTSIKSLAYYAFLIHLASLLRTKPVIFANGIGPINSKMGWRLLKSTLSHCEYISLRDKGSQSIIAKLMQGKKEARLSSDQVFSVTPIDIEEAQKILLQNQIKEDFIAIQIRGKTSFASESKLAESISRIAEEEALVPVFFPMQESEDLEICRSLALKTNGKVVTGINEKELAGILALSSSAIGMRLHFIILCILSGKPVTAIPYDEKVINILKYIGCAECLADGDANDIYEKYHYIKQNKERIARTFKEQAALQKQKAIEDINSLIELISKNH